MKTLKVVFATCAVMTSVMAFAAATGGWTKDLELGTAVPQFTESAANPTSAQWNTVPTVEEKSSTSYFLIDHDDFSTSNEFTAASATGSNYVECVFNLLAAPVVEQVKPSDSVQAAFCISNTTFYGWAKAPDAAEATWLPLSGTVPATDAAYQLKVAFDYHKGVPHVQFSVGGVPLAYTYDTDKTTNWLQSAKSNATSIQKYCFLGSGYVESFLCNEFSVVADVLVDGVGDVEMSVEKQEAAEKTAAAKGTTVAGVLASDASTIDDDFSTGSMSVSTAMAFGFIVEGNDGLVKNPDTDSKLVVTKRAPTVAEPGKIPLALNFTQPSDNNATITYTLKGSSDGTNYSDLDGYSAKKKIEDVAIPTSLIGTGTGQFRYFKVTATVTYGTKN